MASLNSIQKSSHVGVINEGDYVMLKKGDVYKAVQVLKRRKIIFEKQWFYLDNAIGEHYGSKFEVASGGGLRSIKETTEDTSADVKAAGADNRNIVDDGKSQKLTRDDIEALKEKGLKGEVKIDMMVENTDTTFRISRPISRDSFIKKSSKKYETTVTLLRPTARLLALMYIDREPSKICHLRYDTLAQMLTLGNIHAGSKVIVMETCAGLVLGAVMERMGGFGSVIHVYPSGGPVRAATDSFGFPSSFYNGLYGLPVCKIKPLLSGTFFAKSSINSEPEAVALVAEENDNAVDKKNHCEQEEEGQLNTASTTDDSRTAGEEEERMEVVSEDPEKQESKEKSRKKCDDNAQERRRRQEDKMQKQLEAANLLRDRNADGLIIACRFHPCQLLLSLVEFLAPSRPFVVYCLYKEPLLECYTMLRERGGVVSLRVSETWLRHYQVLPNRTHPKPIMSGGGGYLLTGTTVAMNSVKLAADASDSLKNEEPACKKQKTEDS
ncbi:tRNA (adenine(58)-N(1))-methyltransferase non-catalytic subunit TRM6 [Protopterus annectens]|uniref:tRNA (adenine(58)-N(1))-methyltransferase non-catalytic subunit TRM6 n=1 Tax=Protopterus annectens TaxID=7888 RepID=UPI001CFB8FCE|nr:tRNA (adenine(58)-N(1))-methyltransferase non-catalytic subunit TRM6 [Protopterus annectens]